METNFRVLTRFLTSSATEKPPVNDPKLNEYLNQIEKVKTEVEARELVLTIHNHIEETIQTDNEIARRLLSDGPAEKSSGILETAHGDITMTYDPGNAIRIPTIPRVGGQTCSKSPQPPTRMTQVIAKGLIRDLAWLRFKTPRV